MQVENDITKFPYLKEYIDRFKLTEETLNRVLFVFLGTIYTKWDKPTEDYVIHEKTHWKQQLKYGVEVWFRKYLNDDRFRLEMELEAYGNQIKSIKNREEKNRFKIFVSKALSSPTYGNIISTQDVMKYYLHY